LLVGSGEFWNRLTDDLENASQRTYLQTFSFEGDRVGTALGRALERCPAADRRLLVDGYSLLYHSDRIIPGPAWLNRSFRREVKLTHYWVRRLRDGGAGVRFGNRIGPTPVKLIRRNHKKLAVIDDRIAYFGGINFSDHNFAWHDMMFRVEDPDLAHLMALDFRRSWGGDPVALDRWVGPLRVILLSGRGNANGMRPILEGMSSARRSIDVVSPYLSHPFTEHLGAACRRGVRVRVLTPRENNKANLARHILHTAHLYGFEVFHHPHGMSHMKAMLIDDELLVVGSSNLDFMGYHILEDVLVMTRDRAMVDAFIKRVWEPDLASASPICVRPSAGTLLGHAAVRIGALVASALALP
jgi:cardiolipin synthase